MRIALTFVALAFSQLKFSLVHATEGTGDQNTDQGVNGSVSTTGAVDSSAQVTTAGSDLSRTTADNKFPSQNVDLRIYEEVFPTVEMRFKAVMGMLKAGNPNVELVELLVSKLGGISDDSSNVENTPVSDPQAAASGVTPAQSGEASGGPTGQTKPSGTQDSPPENPSETIKIGLTSVCDSLNKLFTELFGDYSDMATKELTKEKVFLNLRFALPLFVKDLKKIGELSATQGDAEAALLKKWVAENFSEVKANPSISVDKVKEHLAALKIGTSGNGDNGVEILSNAVIAYNTRNVDFETAKKECKSLVSSADFRSGSYLRGGAAFGSVAALMTAVLIFTVF